MNDVIGGMWQLPVESRSRRRWVVAAVGLIAAGAGFVGFVESRGSATGYRITMIPAAPLTPAACLAEADRLRMVRPAGLCRPPAARPWFRITLRNVHDGDGFPVCTATALDRGGHPLFTRDVPIGRVGGEPSGPAVQRGTVLRLTWYFDAARIDRSYTRDAPWTSAGIRSYAATCHGRPESQVPI